MENVFDHSNWRDIIDQEPTERELYNQNSLGDYIDFIRFAYGELVADFKYLNVQAAAYVLRELQDEVDAYLTVAGPIDKMFISGNGAYYPEHTDTVEFFDGTTGIAGDFAGLTIQELPAYQDLINSSNGQQQKYQLCLVLSDYSQCSSTGIAPEASGDSALIPIEGQDLCFSRQEQLIEVAKPKT